MSRKSIEAEQKITAKEVAVSYAEENLQGFSEYEARRKYEMDQIIARKMVKRIFATVLACILLVSIMVIVIIGADLI